MSEAKGIQQAILAIMREIGAIGKDRKNEHQNYRFRSIEDVYNRVQPLMVRYGVINVPKVLDFDHETSSSAPDRNTGDIKLKFHIWVRVQYTFMVEDGSSVEVVMTGEAMDHSDKSSNKAVAAAHKYAICQLLNIPYEHMDPDEFSPGRLRDTALESELNALRMRWWPTVKAKLAEADEDTRRQAFVDWATAIVTIDGSPHDPSCWTVQQIRDCNKALDKAAADALTGSGLRKGRSKK